MSCNRFLPALPLLALACAAPAAMAADAEPPSDSAEAPAPHWTHPASLTLASDYRFRGLTQTNSKPALQAGIEFDHAGGFYAGAWGSNISWLSDLTALGAGQVSSSLELDAYVGYRLKFADDWGLDVGAYTYWYPGDYPPGFTRPDTTELYVALGWGIASLKYSHALTNLFGLADSAGSGYLDLSANWEFAPAWVLNAHAGRQRVDGASEASYSDFKLGVTKNFAGNGSIALAWLDTNAERALYTNPHGTYVGRATGLLTITKTF
jgi:uncharacterized protein (TIGR02001 family)